MTEKERSFVQYWEQHREAESLFFSKLMRGLPMAILFTLPIILSVVVVWLFFPDWYMKISGNSAGAFVTVIIAMLAIVLFYSWFRMHYKWEMNEQLYQELKSKENKIKDTGNAGTNN
ncbi:MAG: hypothetical protein QM791_01750 [Ferruginibacter sp.]